MVPPMTVSPGRLAAGIGSPYVQIGRTHLNLYNVLPTYIRNTVVTYFAHVYGFLAGGP